MKYILIFSTALFLLFAAFNCKSPTAPQGSNQPDTTSQNFSFSTYQFGDGSESSYFNDVWIFNSNNIWAVGYVYDSTYGRKNIIHWDGKSWASVGTQFSSSGIYGIWAKDTNTIYFAVGAVIKYENGKFIEMDLGNLGFTNGQGVQKLWGSSAGNIWGIGPWGTIVYYDGRQWSRINFDAQWYFLGITGNPNTGVAYAVARNQNHRTLVVELNNNTASTIFVNNDSLEYFGSWSITYQNEKLYLGEVQIWSLDVNTLKIEKLYGLPGSYGITMIASESANDIYYFGSEVPFMGRMVHYNGARYTIFNIPYRSDNYGGAYAIRDLAAYCGYANNKAFITIIKRSDKCRNSK